MMRVLLVLSVISYSTALYEEPPGGCQGPPDDFIPPPKPKPKPQRGMYDEPPGGCQGPPDDYIPPVRSQKRAPLPPPSEADSKEVSPEDIAASLEKELYEKESIDMMALPEEDWDTIEQEHLRELFWRGVIQRIAASLTMAFVLYLLWARYAQIRSGGKEEAPKAGAAKEGSATTAKADEKADAKADAKADERADEKAEEKAEEEAEENLSRTPPDFQAPKPPSKEDATVTPESDEEEVKEAVVEEAKEESPVEGKEGEESEEWEDDGDDGEWTPPPPSMPAPVPPRSPD